MPERKFRDSYFARKYKLTFAVENLPVGYETIYAHSVDLVNESANQIQDFSLENRFLKVEVAANGTYTILDKETSVEVSGVGAYEDVGDIGNEYMFKETGDNLRINTLNSKPDNSSTTRG